VDSADDGEPEGGTVGLDANRTVLWAQVLSGDPQMSIDSDLRLRPPRISGNPSVYLGDVARAAIRSLGPADPPFFDRPPGYDEQKWTLSTRAGDVSMSITSNSYWAFGLFGKCFLNRIEMTGPLPLRARIVHDIAASLGRNPWEPVAARRFERVSGASPAEHRAAWQDLIESARAEMNEEIAILDARVARLRGETEIDGILAEADNSLDEARSALADHNAPAVERALARAISALVEADPTTEIRTSSRLADGSGEASWWSKSTREDEVEASHLLEDEVPLVDLTEDE